MAGIMRAGDLSRKPLSHGPWAACRWRWQLSAVYRWWHRQADQRSRLEDQRKSGRPSGGLGGWPVAVQDAGAVGAGRGDGAVGVQGDFPAPPVHGDEMVKR